jgi:thioredoxin-dependent peroxiredoxin
MNLFKTIWLGFLIVWGIPLGIYRSKFRKIVYQTDSWLINIKPVFMKEVKALIGNLYPSDNNYLKFRNFYRLYLVIYTFLFAIYLLITSFMTETDIMQRDQVKTGSHIPEFALPDQTGKIIDIKSLIGKKNLVIYFYPKDDTPGCTKEACSFRDQFEDFREADAEILGISGDGVESHKQFAEKYRLTFTLLSDQGNNVRKMFGVPTNFLGLIQGRVTYVVNKQGVVVHMFNSQTQAKEHIREAIKALKALDKK